MRASDFDMMSSRPQLEPGPAVARGTALGRFIVLGLVGRGAMGEVYAAYDPELDRKIAIKLLRARADAPSDHRARLMREAKATAKISHPNVVVVYDAGTFGERVFIAMEFVEGHTIRYWLQSGERTWQEVLDAFLAAGRGLAAAHEKELVHRDFKPDNVMVASGGHVRVMDFGLARFVADAGPQPGAEVDFEGTIELAPGSRPALPAALGPLDTSASQLTATGTVLGTPAYMSPEQFRSQPADARSDQFSFCVALYEALYGARPFGGRTLAELSENVIAGRLERGGATARVPPALRPILARGLSSDPAERFPTMTELLEALARHSGAGKTSFARGAAAKLAGVWEPPESGAPVETPAKAAMRAAFLATGKPYASAAFAGASAVLDRFAQRWSELYVEVCEATHVRGEQSAEILDLRMACLAEGLDDLKALCRLFREATAQVVENAVKAAHALGTLERVSDVKLLRAIVRPPEDPETRAAVEALRRRLAEARALMNVGKTAAGLEAIVPLVVEARRLAYGPLLAEVLIAQGQLQIDAFVIGDASPVLEDAFSTAVLSRHDEIAAQAAMLLLYQNGYLWGRFDVAEVWSRSAEALLRRLGGHDLIWGWYLSARAGMREQQGRLAEAAEDHRAAIATIEQAFGPENSDVASLLGNLANHLAHIGDFASALEMSDRAIRTFSASLGPEHPRYALFVANRAQFLWRLGRIDEARIEALRVLETLERETTPGSMVVSVPLRTLGLCHLQRGERRLAIAYLERGLAIRETIGTSAVKCAEVRGPLARALYDEPGQRARALALAEQALREYGSGAMLPVAGQDRAQLEQWLAERIKAKQKPGGRPAKRAARAAAKRPAKPPTKRPTKVATKVATKRRAKRRSSGRSSRR